MQGYHPRQGIGLLMVAVVLVALLLAVAQPVEAARSYFGFSNARVNCDQGGVRVDAAWNLLPGATIREWLERRSDTRGTETDYNEAVVEQLRRGTLERDIEVPVDGFVQITVEVTDANGYLVSTAILYATCPSGQAWTRFIDGIPGQLPPPPEERVMVEVRIDTHVYATPGVGDRLPAILRAGQTWFAIDATQHRGRWWVQIYVGGEHAPWVPAVTLRLLEPLPELEE